MAVGIGALTKMSMALHSSNNWYATWAGTGHKQIPFSTESLTKNISQIEYPILQGRVSQTRPSPGFVSVGDNFVVLLDYVNCDDVIKAAMGAESGGLYTFDNALEQLVEINVDRQVSRAHIAAAKIVGFSLGASSMQDTLAMTCNVVGRNLEISSDAFGTPTGFTDLTPITMKHLTFKIGPLGAALDSSDTKCISGFNIDVNRNFATDIYSTVCGTDHDDASFALEPVINGFRETTMTLDLPKYDSDAFITWKNNSTVLQAAFEFVSGTKEFHIELPELVITEGFNAETSGPEMRTLSGTFRAYYNDDNTHMSHITEELAITIV